MGKSGGTLHIKEWKEDVVYLFQFPRIKELPNISPFCLKVESFLRLHGIKHEVKETNKVRTRQGLLPMIELNGRQIEDSGAIISHLRKHFNIQDYSDEKEAAQGRAIAKACDYYTFNVTYKYKLLDNPKKMVAVILAAVKGSGFVKSIASVFLTKNLSGKAKNRIGSSIGIWPDGTHEEMLREDLRMYESLLKNFAGHNFFGDKITEADLTVWSHLAILLYLPYDILPKKLLQEEFPHTKSFIERIREKLWPDFVHENFEPTVTISH
ncbi:unnamed protein product, partial [Mesorhabditis spiculigera]